MSGGRPARGLAREELVHQLDERRMKAVPRRRQERERVHAERPLDHFGAVATRVRWSAAEEPIEQRAHPVDVGRRRQKPDAARLLGAQVPRCPRDHGRRIFGGGVRRGARRGEAEVRELDARDLPVPAFDEDVLRLDVAVDDARVVRVAERVEDLSGDVDDGARRELVRDALEARAVDALEREVRLAVGQSAGLEEPDDARVRQARCERGFPAEPERSDGARRIRQLQRGERAVSPVTSRVHESRAAAREQPEKLVVADALGWRGRDAARLRSRLLHGSPPLASWSGATVPCGGVLDLA